MKTRTKLIHYIPLTLVIILLMGISACTDNFEEINTPPTSSINIDPAFLLTNTQISLIRYKSTESPNNVIGSWVQHWAGAQLFGGSRYVPEEYDGIWNNYYRNLKNLGQIRNELLAGLEDDPTGRTKLAIAKIMEIYYWQDLTDMYGPVPYSESTLKVSELVRQPKFDDQESIYRSLISNLDIALSQHN